MKQPTRPADGLSILCLASAIAALVTMLFSLIPMLGMCLAPVSVLCVAVAAISGVASLIRTALQPQLEGRAQALAGLGLLLVWGAGAAVAYNILARYR